MADGACGAWLKARGVGGYRRMMCVATHTQVLEVREERVWGVCLQVREVCGCRYVGCVATEA